MYYNETSRMFVKLIKAIALGSFLIVSYPGFAHKCINVDFFEFASKKGLRVCVFDTDKQKYDYIDYYPFPSSSKSRQTKEELPNTYYGLKLFYDGKVSIPAGFNLQNYIIRAREIKYNDSTQFPDDWLRFMDVNGTIALKMDNRIYKGNTILNRLNKFSSPKVKPPFKVCFESKGKEVTRQPFSNISSDRHLNNIERGYLGELATEFTLFSFGYSIKHDSKYGPDHGLDGVFEDDSMDPELFITESKCRKESKSVETYMDECLSEKNIFDFLQAMKRQSQTVKITGTLIQGYISNKPHKLFKFVHRIKDNGEAQCFVQKFNICGYASVPFFTITPNSPNNKKLIALRKLLASLYTTSEDSMRALLEQYGIAKEDTDAVLNIIEQYKNE